MIERIKSKNYQWTVELYGVSSQLQSNENILTLTHPSFSLFSHDLLKDVSISCNFAPMTIYF